MPEPTYVIGIDLGTTNSVVAYTETAIEKGDNPQIHVLEIPQLVDAGVVEKRSVLPSFILLPGEHDVAEESLTLPWPNDPGKVVGEFAKNRGAELPQRLIASSKSWLCHTMVDRTKAILPWEGPEELAKLSPVEAASVMLAHIRNAWNHTIAGEDENLKMEYQDVLLTVPASFDAVARELTVKGAEMAGLSQVTLLEEPQAAFYAWIDEMGDEWRKNVDKGDLVLVCDVGGGTSDFSLIKVTEEEGDLVLDRIAVGDHLLVGGDNMDLALAYNASQIVFDKKKIDPWQMRSLWHACRKAKEELLTDDETNEYMVTILGRGKKLIGGSKKVNLTRQMVEQVILDGFFPACAASDTPVAPQRSGIQEVGLAYESDPAVTRHMAHFLSRQSKEEGKDLTLPTAVLFNGGIMKAASVRKKIMTVLNSWQDDPAQEKIREIDNRDYDLTVARGAAYYGLARRGTGIRIRGGLNRTYYIGVAASMPAVPGMPVPMRALCVAPFGMEEGTDGSIPGQEFALVVGESVKFDFMGSTVRLEDGIGTVIDDWEEDEIEEITTIETTLDGDAGTTTPVVIEVRVTEIGTLELWCVSKLDPEKRWKLEFNVREQSE